MTDEHSEEAELNENLAAIARSQEDIRACRVQDAREAMREIAAETSLRLER
jgi:hypothetical protein